MNKINRNIASIIRTYLLPSKLYIKILFKNNIDLLNNTRNLLYIETLSNNLCPSFFKKSYIKINGTNIAFDDELFDLYLKMNN